MRTGSTSVFFCFISTSHTDKTLPYNIVCFKILFTVLLLHSHRATCRCVMWMYGCVVYLYVHLYESFNFCSFFYRYIRPKRSAIGRGGFYERRKSFRCRSWDRVFAVILRNTAEVNNPYVPRTTHTHTQTHIHTATGWTVRGLNSSSEMFSSSKNPDRLWGPSNPLFNFYVGSFLGVKRPGREFDHSSPSSAEVKNEWSYTSAPLRTFMTWAGTALLLYLICVCVCVCTHTHTHTHIPIYIHKTLVQKFSKNLGPASKFEASEGWHEARSNPRWEYVILQWPVKPAVGSSVRCERTDICFCMWGENLQ